MTFLGSKKEDTDSKTVSAAGVRMEWGAVVMDIESGDVSCRDWRTSWYVVLNWRRMW